MGQAYDELAVLHGLQALDAHCLQAAALRQAPTERWLGWDGFRPLPAAEGAAPGRRAPSKSGWPPPPSGGRCCPRWPSITGGLVRGCSPATARFAGYATMRAARWRA